MGRTVGIGIQGFDKIIEKNCFYVDKTDFIREWWESKEPKERSDAGGHIAGGAAAD